MNEALITCQTSRDSALCLMRFTQSSPTLFLNADRLYGILRIDILFSPRFLVRLFTSIAASYYLPLSLATYES